MGVPKFFRWMSERYPLCSELIGKSRIPEFDNLYLDMNGIIHNCSHPNDDDPLFRITETQIFISIFSYIDYVFSTIKPRKVFMMAVDGVAPRAKMNQQRARRFRSAMDAKMNAEKAERAGTVLPKEAAFDSNCITPGTPFMDRLQAQLKYYINKKISEDSAWREITVILSGHDVPGEGEHKIMEYIRNSKAAPGYDPNIRHCLYGLDADLVMLGLLSHEPHFSLLREEVTFGRKPKRATKTASEQNFYLLHLSLIREYLGFEFESLQDKLSFPYDFERILDDFILMCFFVGNDFLPHLPGLHINEGGLATLFDIYKSILPQCNGYLNENGKLNVKYCQIFFEKLEELEVEEFKNFQGDSSWLQGKKNSSKQAPQKPKLSLSKRQVELFELVKSFLLQPRTSDTLQFNWSKTPAGDRAFLLQLISSVGLIHSIEAGEDYTMIEIGWDQDDDESDEESNEARARVIRKYETAERQIIKSKQEEVADKQVAFDEALSAWKRDYYKEKLEFSSDYEGKVSKIVYSYVEGLQWVLLYYYHGVASWEWFFPYHYGPKISDLKQIAHLEFNFQLGSPFFPFEQLMAVLPPLSKQHVPPSLQELMIDIHSPIIDFYPSTFELDMNGKTAEWEAIVKIPFIDEKRLLKAVRGRQNMLTADEKRRNSPGTAFLFMYSHGAAPSQYPSPLPSVFPDIFSCFCLMNVFHSIPKAANVAIHKLNDGALLGKYMLPGFPSMYTLQFTSTLGHHGVNVFNADSKNPSHVLTLESTLNETPEDTAMRLIGSTVYSEWPFLVESHVLQLSDEFFVYEKKRGKGKDVIVKTPHNDHTLSKFAQSAERGEKIYSKRYGVMIGVTDMVAKIESLVGMQLLTDGSVVKEFKIPSEYDTPIQLLVLEDHHDPRFDERPRPPIHEEFPYGSGVFFLSPKIYGNLCEVVPSDQANGQEDTINLQVTLPCATEFHKENQGPSVIAKTERDRLQYFPGWQIAKKIRLSAYTLSRITSNFQITLQDSHQKLNIGLCLKFESKGLKVLGYTRKGEKGWEYSQRALDLIEDYRRTFPSILEKIERGGNVDFFLDVDFFPTNTKDSIVKVQKWLAQKGIKQLLAVPLNSVSLTKEAVSKIEANVDEYNQNLAAQEFEPILIKSVPRKNILKPSHSVFRLLHQTFELGDRVISTVDFGNVPMAAKGTVVGIEKEKLDVCWDFGFMHATTLDGLCSSPRGCSVEKFSVLNLTNVQPPYALEKKLELPKQKPKYFPPPQKPKVNQWDKGAPRPIQNEQLQMETMLKSMLHINATNGDAVMHNYDGGHSMYHPGAFMVPHGQHPHIMDPSAPSFTPLGPTSYDSSWRPPVPMSATSVSVPPSPHQYDEMTMQLLSILHANPNQTSPHTGQEQDDQQNGEKRSRGGKRGGRGRGGNRNQNYQQPHDQPSSPQTEGGKSRKQFVLKKKSDQ